MARESYLFRILPRGVVSKNAMVECMIPSNIPWWRREEAFRLPTWIEAVATMMKIA